MVPLHSCYKVIYGILYGDFDCDLVTKVIFTLAINCDISKLGANYNQIKVNIAN